MKEDEGTEAGNMSQTDCLATSIVAYNDSEWSIKLHHGHLFMVEATNATDGNLIDG